MKKLSRMAWGFAWACSALAMDAWLTLPNAYAEPNAETYAQPSASIEASKNQLFGRPGVSNAALEDQRGGSDTQVFNLMDLNADQRNNTARDTVSGANSVSSGAFTNANGLATVIQNSGNNVVIQNATILNLDLK